MTNPKREGKKLTEEYDPPVLPLLPLARIFLADASWGKAKSPKLIRSRINIKMIFFLTDKA